MAPESAAPSIDPGESGSLPTASVTPAATAVPVPAVGGDGGNQVLVVGLAGLLLVLLLGFFLALRRRKPKPAA